MAQLLSMLCECQPEEDNAIKRQGVNAIMRKGENDRSENATKQECDKTQLRQGENGTKRRDISRDMVWKTFP